MERMDVKWVERVAGTPCMTTCGIGMKGTRGFCVHGALQEPSHKDTRVSSNRVPFVLSVAP